MARGRPRGGSRDEILRVFAEHVADRGYADTSLGEIAAELKLSKSTILHHFQNKEAMLGEVHAAYFTRRFAEAEYVHATLPDPASRLTAMIYALLAAHRDDRAASLACLRELVRYFEGDLNDYVRTQRMRYTRIVVDILQEGIREGHFRPTDPSMSALQIFGMCNYAWTWYRPDGAQSIEAIAQVFVRNIVGGLAQQEMGDAELDELFAEAARTVDRAPGRLPQPRTPRSP